MADFNAEVYGRIYDAQESYFPEPLVDAILCRKPQTKSFTQDTSIEGATFIYIGIDPPSHNVSSMGLSAITYSSQGQAIIIGIAEISAKRCQTAEIQMCVTHFTKQVIMVPILRRTHRQNIVIIPIVECNNCGILSASIVAAIRQATTDSAAAFLNPFTSKNYAKEINNDIGYLTTEDSKLRAILHTYNIIVDNRLSVYNKFVVMGPIHLLAPITPSRQQTLSTLKNSLAAFKDNEKGKISGKTPTTNDDAAMSLIMALSHSNTIRLRVKRGDPILDKRYRD